MIQKACAVVLHPDGDPLRVLMFEHPQAGLQLIKGGIKSGETIAYAGMRELYEESGLETVSAHVIGASDRIVEGQEWHFVLCRIKTPVRDQWQHFYTDDGGHLFRFFWQDLNTLPETHPTFVNAFKEIQGFLS